MNQLKKILKMKLVFSICAFSYFIFPFKTEAQTEPNQLTEDVYRQKIKEKPNQAINYFNLAVVLQKNGKFQEAIDQYNKSIELKSSLTPVAIYYKARAYESLGNKTEAQRLISSINLEKIPTQLKSRVLAYKNKLFADSVEDLINETETTPPAIKDEKRLSLFLDYSWGRIYNPSSYSKIYSSSITTESQKLFKAGVDVLAAYNSYFDLKFNYFYSQTNYDQTTSLNYKYHDFNLPVSFYFAQSRIKVNAEYFTDSYEETKYSEQNGISVDYAYKLSDNYLNLWIQKNEIKNKVDSYSYLSGQQYKYLLGFEQNFALSKMAYRFYYSDYKYQDTTSLGASYVIYGLNLSYSYQLSRLDMLFSATGEIKNYKLAALSPPARKDQRWLLNSEIGYSVSPFLRIYLNGSTVTNQSNYDTTTNDVTYNQYLYSLGLSASY